VSLHAMEQLWKCVTEGEDLELPIVNEDSDSSEDLMAKSIQAFSGTEGSKTVRLRGHMKGKEVFMLVDSGSSTSYISDQLVSTTEQGSLLPQPVKVQVANGEILNCTHELQQL